MPQELQVIQDFYDLSLGLSGRILKFPRNVRYGLGLAIERRLQDVLALLMRAKYAPAAEKGPLLSTANVELEVLRFQVRQAADLKALPLKGQNYVLEKLFAVGSQVGGWLKSMGGRS